MNDSVVISLNGLRPSESFFNFHLGKEFFAKFENEDILDADLRLEIVVDKQPGHVDFDCRIKGTLTVPCDRCLSPVEMDVETSGLFRLRMDASRSTVEEPYEEVFLPDGKDELNLNQEIYDYSLLALPLQRFHDEGECDSVALDYLSSSDAPAAPSTDAPFSDLAMLLNDNLK